MPKVTPTQVADNVTKVNAASVNTPINEIAVVVNALDNENIATGANISGEKLADGTLPIAKLSTKVETELGRTTLGSNGDTLAVTFSPRKYIKVRVAIFPNGNLNSVLRFNDDGGANYAERYSADSAASTIQVSQTSLNVEANNGGWTEWVVMEILNFQNQEKQGKLTCVAGTSGGAQSSQDFVNAFKWANSSSQINKISFINSGSGDYGTGSEIVVLGHD